MSRTPAVVALLLLFPIIQIILFGYAINVNPKHLPTAVINYDNSQFTRKFISALQNTQYFSITDNNISEDEVKSKIKNGKILFALHIPSDFTYQLIRDEKPHMLIEADGTDITSINLAVATINQLVPRVFQREFTGSLNRLQSKEPSFNVNIHRLYNPNIETTLFIVPGLIGLILTLSLSMVTSGAVVIEKENFTIETILNSTISKYEYIAGIIIPYTIIGYLQMSFIIIVAVILFAMPIYGNLYMLYIAALPFILGNLMVGLMASSVAKNLLEAQQYVIFYFLPSVLLSGFMFPFYGMPGWAQTIGNVLPLTHFLRITRGVLIKEFNWYDIWINLWPTIIFLFVASLIALMAHKKSLD